MSDNHSPDYILSKLTTHTHADKSSYTISCNKCKYTLILSRSIGSGTIKQISEVSEKTAVPLELDKIAPHDENRLRIIVEEDIRRPSLDENQKHFTEFTDSK